MQLLQVYPSPDSERFYNNRGSVKCCLVHVSETTRGERSGFTFEGCRWQHKQGREYVKGATQLSEVLQVLFALLSVEIDFFEGLSS